VGSKATGSAHALAREVGVSYATVYRELEAMKDYDLVVTEWAGASQLYRANFDHPDAAVLQRLVATRPRAGATSTQAQVVKSQLQAFGAPLAVAGGAPAPESLEALAVEAVKLAHRDPAVARSLPVFFWKNWDELDVTRLVALARKQGEQRGLNLFLRLTSQVSGDPRFRKAARGLGDRRVRAIRDFFQLPVSAGGRNAFVDKGSQLRLGLSKADVASLFDKFAHDQPADVSR
jgi:hypothetical protein